MIINYLILFLISIPFINSIKCYNTTGPNSEQIVDCKFTNYCYVITAQVDGKLFDLLPFKKGDAAYACGDFGRHFECEEVGKGAIDFTNNQMNKAWGKLYVECCDNDFCNKPKKNSGTGMMGNIVIFGIIVTLLF